MEFITIQQVQVEKPTRRKTARGAVLSYRWAPAWAVRGTNDSKTFYDLIQPYESGHGAKGRAMKKGRAMAEARGVPFHDPA